MNLNEIPSHVFAYAVAFSRIEWVKSVQHNESGKQYNLQLFKSEHGKIACGVDELGDECYFEITY